MLDVNTVNKYPTHFARGVELVIQARGKFNIPSENWPHPTEYKFGIPNDRYYAEIWVDGMDWQPSYWIIEEKNLEKPQIQPFIIFDSNENRHRFEDYDFSELIRASLWYRRDLFFIKQNDLSYFTDTVWPFLYTVKEIYKPGFSKVYFKHASQERVDFIMNTEFIPPDYLGREERKRWFGFDGNPAGSFARSSGDPE
jgi:hypothetical protein